jgi:hypothetical protein
MLEMLRWGMAKKRLGTTGLKSLKEGFCIFYLTTLSIAQTIQRQMEV